MSNTLDISFTEDLHDQSKVWVYHADRVFTDAETIQIDQEISIFCNQWVSHNRQLKAVGKILLNRIVVLLVDETMAGASGCSIDTSVAFVKNIGLKYQTNLFDRMLITYLDKDTVQTVSLHDLGEQISENSDEVLFFDNLIKTKQDLEKKSLVPVKGSWVERFV